MKIKIKRKKRSMIPKVLYVTMMHSKTVEMKKKMHPKKRTSLKTNNKKKWEK